MTLDEKCNISRLQQQGMGYRKIASELGISENTVKSYLRRHSKIKSSEEISGGCKRCGKAIEQKLHKRKKNSALIIAAVGGGVRVRICLEEKLQL